MNVRSLFKLLVRRWCLFCAVRLLLFVLCPCVARGEEPLSWPNQGPYQRVGENKYRWSFKPIDMPVAVVKAAQRHLDGSPAQWLVETYPNYAQQHKTVVFLFSGKGKGAYLVTDEFWVELLPHNMSSLDQVIGHVLKERDLGDEEKLSSYLGWLDTLLLTHSLLMDDRFFKEVEQDVALFDKDSPEEYKFTPKRRRVFRRLCHRPTVVIHGSNAVITYNALLRWTRGAIRRTAYIKVGKWIKVTGIDSVIISKDSFAYTALSRPL